VARTASQRAAVRAEQEDAARAARRRAEESATWKDRAIAAESAGGEEDLGQAEGFYLRALGLVPDDPSAAASYGRVVARRAMLTAERRSAEDELKAEAERRISAEALLARAEESVRAGATAAAVTIIESAMAIMPSPESGRRLGELVTKLASEEAEQRTAARRAEANQALAALAAALAAGDSRAAAVQLERARAAAADHPGLTAATAQVEAQRRRELEAGAEISLAAAALSSARAATEAGRLRELTAAVMTQRSELAEQGGAAVRFRLHESERALAASASLRATALAETIALLDRASADAPWHPPVRAALTAHWIDRLADAEAEGDPAEAAAAEAQARAWDDGSRAALLTGQAVVEVPAGALAGTLQALHVTSERVLAPAGEPFILNPGTSVTLPHGRYLATQGAAVTALRVARGVRLALALDQPPALPPGTAWIPSGHLRDQGGSLPVAGFALARYEVSVGEWLEFLNDPAIRRRFDAAQAEGQLILAPRASATADGPLWPRNRNLFSAESARGEAIPPLAPVTGISWQDAADYAAWRAQRDGVAWRLPTADEWRFALQGGDGRAYPWGDLPDPGHCASLRTCPQDLAQAVTVGSFPLDRSAQGVFDLAGSVSEWTATSAGRLRLALGGNRFDRDGERFSDHARRDVDPRLVHAVIGLRLAVTP
jgi:formylglycine-generating enzyme required for sulfatase activity